MSFCVIAVGVCFPEFRAFITLNLTVKRQTVIKQSEGKSQETKDHRQEAELNLLRSTSEQTKHMTQSTKEVRNVCRDD